MRKANELYKQMKIFKLASSYPYFCSNYSNILVLFSQACAEIDITVIVNIMSINPLKNR